MMCMKALIYVYATLALIDGKELNRLNIFIAFCANLSSNNINLAEHPI